MQQFQVPQFITVEDKVIGPLTIKQFAYLLPGIVIIIAAYQFLKFSFFVPIAALTAAFFCALAFLKINEQPLPIVIKNIFFFYKRPRLYLWKKIAEKNTSLAPSGLLEKKSAPVINRGASRLSDLALNLDMTKRVR